MVEAAVATITLEGPSLTADAKQDLLQAISQVSSDEQVRCVVLTGTGKVFCAGQDLGEHAATLRTDPKRSFQTIQDHYIPIIKGLITMDKPVVASINGTCAGAGLSLAMACDIRIAARTARFVTAFTGIGLSFDSGLSATLARSVGMARASELILLNEPFSADEALSWGLVGKVVPPEELANATAATAGKLAAGPTAAYAAAKRAIQDAWAAPLADLLDYERRTQESLGTTRDHKVAVEAFLAKQAPTFTGR